MACENSNCDNTTCEKPTCGGSSGGSTSCNGSSCNGTSGTNIVCVTGIRVIPSNVNIKVDECYTLGAETSPSNATNPRVSWSSADPEIVSVNEDGGYIYGISEGTTKIYASARDGSGVRDYCTVKVSNTVKVTSIRLSDTSISLEKGSEHTLTATISPQNATEKGLLWYSDNPDVASVDNGVIYAKSIGTARITAAAKDTSGKSAYCNVTVTSDVLVNRVIVEPSSLTLTVGESEYLYETVLPNNAANTCVIWSSSDTSVATVTPTSGFVYAQGEGTATIYATAQDGSGKRGSCFVTVEPVVPVCSITLSSTTEEMSVGDTTQLIAEICPSNATNKSLTWTSSDPDVASVTTHSGIVTANAYGTATITATSDDDPNIYATCEIRIGYTSIINGKKITVYSEDDELLDPFEGEEVTGLHVYANDMLITSALEDSDGNITVCMGEIVQALCTDYFLDVNYGNSWFVQAAHYDIKVTYSTTYYANDLGLCPFHNINDRISLTQFVEDLGYSSKYSEIAYPNGARIIIIQGPDPYSSGNLSSFPVDSIASMMIGFIPAVGDVKDLAEGIYGKDLITGEDLSAFDRVLCIGCTLLPIVNGAAVRVGRKGFAKIDNVVEFISELPDAKRVVVYSDIWDVLRPTTRGLCFEIEFAKKIYKAADGWHHIGKEMNGFFPVIDFIQVAEKLDDTRVISLKTLDPRLYKLADGSYDAARIKRVITKYAGTLGDTHMTVEGKEIVLRQLDIVVPDGYGDLVKGYVGQTEGLKILPNIIEN